MKDEQNTKIVVLDGFTANPGDLSWEGLRALGQLTVYERTKPEEVIERSEDADILLTNKVCLRRREIELLPRLRYIGVLATGYNVIDTDAAHERGITVTNVPAYSTDSVAQMVFAHLLAVTNQTAHYARQNREGRWAKASDFCYWDTPLTELTGKTMGIVGLGNIGLRVASIARAFGMKVIALTSKSALSLPAGISKVSREELFRRSDVLTLHCPLTPNTHQMVNAETLQLMKPSAIVINTGRGPLVNEADMAEALNSRRLAAYCADVLCQEPPDKGHPLTACPNAFITPHIAWATHEARERLLETVTENIKAFLHGAPIHTV